MSKYHGRIAVLPGDGIGPEVMEEAIKVVEKIKKNIMWILILSMGI